MAAGSAAGLAEIAGIRPADADFLGAGPGPIEDYALIGDCAAAALVRRNGSIEWLCWPRFDSPACFAALLGGPAFGAWRIAPVDAAAATRRYLDDTLVVETVFKGADGEVAITDAMLWDAPVPTLVRCVSGRAGRVAMRMVAAPRFGTGSVAPQWSICPGGCVARSAEDAVTLQGPMPLEIAGGAITAEFDVATGEAVTFILSAGAGANPFNAAAALASTLRCWAAWTECTRYGGRYHAAVRRSLLTLKALTDRRTGAMVAAPTTSLPEQAGGSRNWDYRYCWLRDSALAALALLRTGHVAEAVAWRDWLRRTIGDDPSHAQIVYCVGGERDLAEREAAWLPGYQGARPVRLGNAAQGQVQLDVYGELIDTLHAIADLSGRDDPAWILQCTLLAHLEQVWQMPDEGIWETRGGRRRFTFSRVMAWVVFDRAIRAAEAAGRPAPLDQWRATRAAIHAAVCADGFDAAHGHFVQSIGSDELDASLLLLPVVGFLPPDDPRVLGTVAAIERDLIVGGLVRRYRSETGGDGLPAGEGVFLACSFWLVEVYALQGRIAEARALFEAVLHLRNDVGLLAEEYDPVARRLMGNFPQAYSHLALINAALALEAATARLSA